MAELPLVLAIQAIRDECEAMLGISQGLRSTQHSDTFYQDVLRLTDPDTLMEILMNHWATSTSGCSCGGVGLGESWPKHIADLYFTEALGEP